MLISCRVKDRMQGRAAVQVASLSSFLSCSLTAVSVSFIDAIAWSVGAKQTFYSRYTSVNNGCISFSFRVLNIKLAEGETSPCDEWNWLINLFGDETIPQH